MNIKGDWIYGVLHTIYGIALVLCLYEFFIVTEVSLVARVIILLLSVSYAMSLKDFIKRFRGSTLKLEASET